MSKTLQNKSDKKLPVSLKKKVSLPQKNQSLGIRIKKKLEGFTLIELMVVMAIIAILATAGLSAYTGYMKKGRDTSRVQIASDLNTAVTGYMASHQGIPPRDQTEFESFITSSADIFPSGTPTALIKDPVGGRNVCLDAEGHTTEPCRFDYTAYSDGTYAISYGVESDTSTKANFYKTTQSVLDSDDVPTTKYGVYIGTAPFIGSLIAQNNSATPVDDDYTTSFAGKRIDVPVASEGNGGTATCGNGLMVDGFGTIRALDGKCWLDRNLTGYYQWMRKNTYWTADWIGDNNNPDYGDPCPAESRIPTYAEWINLLSAEGSRVNVSLKLNLTVDGYYTINDGSLVFHSGQGFYWSSKTVSLPNSSNFFSSNSNNPVDYASNSVLLSVRCILN